MFEFVEKKRGRPKKEFTRKHVVKVRLDDSEFKMLLRLANENGESYSEALRRALRFYNFKDILAKK